MPNPAVVVTAVGGAGNGEQIVKALRRSELGYVIIGTDVSRHSKGLYDVDYSYLVPPAKDPGYLNAVIGICQHHRVVALFHGSEPELRVLSENRALFADRGIFLPMNLPHVIDLCMDKLRSSNLLAERGFHVPRWRRVASEADLAAVDLMPAVLKPSVGGGGSINLYLAQTPDELHTFGRYLLGLYPEFIVQEYVGTPESEYTVGVLHTMDGDFVNSIAIRRHLNSAFSSRIRVPNRTGRAELGSMLVISSGVSQGDIGRFPEVTQACERIAKELDARGAINIQCRLVDGEVMVFEINPRFSGTTSLRAMVGYNEPDVLVRHHVFGEAVTTRFRYAEGTVMRGLAETFASPQRLMAVGPLDTAAVDTHWSSIHTPQRTAHDTMELRIEHYLPALAPLWGVDEESLRRYLSDLYTDEAFMAAINEKVKAVPEFDGKQFTHPAELRAYRSLLYLVTRASRPEAFVETGVQNGLSSAFILLGLAHNQTGTLYSVDLPPVDQRIIDQGTLPLPLQKEPGWIIPDYLRGRHQLLLGAAEEELPVVLAQQKSIDVFLHDSDHSYSHIMFEVGLAWRYLRAGGHLLVDNIEQNGAFTDFARGVAAPSMVVSTFDGPDRVWQHGVLRRPV
jgi:carbamoyl-phosphate synthase large subunit